MPTTSAGILLYRIRDGVVQVLIGHMGGPFWASKDAAAWSVPKGEYDEEDPLATARREFEEELGQPPPDVELEDLGAFRQAGGKVVRIWAGQGDFDASAVVSNTFELEWPRGSGRIIEVPEIDRRRMGGPDRRPGSSGARAGGRPRRAPASVTDGRPGVLRGRRVSRPLLKMVGLLTGDVVACPMAVPPFAVPTWPDARDG